MRALPIIWKRTRTLRARVCGMISNMQPLSFCLLCPFCFAVRVLRRSLSLTQCAGVCRTGLVFVPLSIPFIAHHFGWPQYSPPPELLTLLRDTAEIDELTEVSKRDSNKRSARAWLV